MLHSNERIDDLQLRGLRLIQNPDWFCFGTDAVLLTHFASMSIKKSASVLDLCTGNGIIPLLLSAKSDADKIFGLEIQEPVSEMACRSVNLNHLGDKIRIDCGDLKNAADIYGKSKFDYITCNPPYKENGGGLTCKDDTVTLARHEILCSLEDIFCISEQLLKPGGKLAMVHRPERLADIITYMRKYHIEPKRLRFIHPSPNKTANMILIEGTRLGRPKLFLEPPLYVYSAPNKYSDEINQIYERKN